MRRTTRSREASPPAPAGGRASARTRFSASARSPAESASVPSRSKRTVVTGSGRAAASTACAGLR